MKVFPSLEMQSHSAQWLMSSRQYQAVGARKEKCTWKCQRRVSERIKNEVSRWQARPFDGLEMEKRGKVQYWIDDVGRNASLERTIMINQTDI